MARQTKQKSVLPTKPGEQDAWIADKKHDFMKVTEFCQQVLHEKHDLEQQLTELWHRITTLETQNTFLKLNLDRANGRNDELQKKVELLLNKSKPISEEEYRLFLMKNETDDEETETVLGGKRIKKEIVDPCESFAQDVHVSPQKDIDKTVSHRKARDAESVTSERSIHTVTGSSGSTTFEMDHNNEQGMYIVSDGKRMSRVHLTTSFVPPPPKKAKRDTEDCDGNDQSDSGSDSDPKLEKSGKKPEPSSKSGLGPGPTGAKTTPTPPANSLYIMTDGQRLLRCSLSESKRRRRLSSVTATTDKIGVVNNNALSADDAQNNASTTEVDSDVESNVESRRIPRRGRPPAVSRGRAGDRWKANGAFCCSTCGLRFTSKNRLNYHVLYDHPKSIYKCSTCGTVCFKLSEVREHAKLHSSGNKTSPPVVNNDSSTANGTATTTTIAEHDSAVKLRLPLKIAASAPESAVAPSITSVLPGVTVTPTVVNPTVSCEERSKNGGGSGSTTGPSTAAPAPADHDYLQVQSSQRVAVRCDAATIKNYGGKTVAVKRDLFNVLKRRLVPTKAVSKAV